MSSSLFQQPKQPNKISQLMQLVGSIQQNNPEQVFNQMYQNNPQFKQFVDENKDLSLLQIAQKYNIPK